MCRSTATENGNFTSDRDELKIRSFHLRFTISPSSSSSSSSSSSIKLPETLTLVYLPRINGNPLEINGVKIRADAPSFVALHRARSMERAVGGGGGEAVYVSVDRVRAGEAVRFEVYVRSQKAMKGVFRRGERGIWGWGLECKSAAEVDLGILRGEVLVGGERGRVLMRERVEMGRGERKRRSKGFCLKLEEIVEEGEREGCDCSCCCCDDDDEEEEDQEWEMVERSEEEEDEGVKWAVEMGIWVICMGVGYLVSQASYRGLRKKRII